MKKNYFAPNTKTIKVKVQHLMVISGNGQNVNSVSVSEETYDSSKGDIMSRRGGSIWDD